MSKKVVYIVILIECILAVFLISFFGQAIFNAVKKIPVQYINFTYADGSVIADGVDIEVDTTSSIDFQLYWEVGPDEAVNKEVSFISSRPDQVKVDPKTGFVTFIEDVDVTITVKSLDGSNVSDSIHLIPYDKDGGEVEI